MTTRTIMITALPTTRMIRIKKKNELRTKNEERRELKFTVWQGTEKELAKRQNGTKDRPPGLTGLEVVDL